MKNLLQCFHDVFEDDDMVVTPDITGEDIDGWDSLTHVRLMLTVERAFSIKLSCSEIGRINQLVTSPN